MTYIKHLSLILCVAVAGACSTNPNTPQNETQALTRLGLTGIKTTGVALYPCGVAGVGASFMAHDFRGNLVTGEYGSYPLQTKVYVCLD